jgi:hypothetical protein
VNTDLQFPATVLEMKRAGRRANVTPDPEHREPFTEVLTMPVNGQYNDSTPLRNPVPGVASLEP